MPNIVGIRFKEAGKIYYFDPAGLELAQNDWAVVETAQGKECGEVILSPREVPDDQIVPPLKKVTRKATADDMKIVEERASKEKHALDVCEEKVRSHNLEMKLVNVEYAFDGSKIIFYFTADGRVDFRALVRDLAAVFRTRIELRQIGVRDEVKMLGGLGPCGREACCKAFLSDFSPVSIRMAKDQNLSLNPTKISGLCGRLMCCLNYEQDHYQSTLQRCPRKGSTVLTPEGPATIEDVLILKEKVKVRLSCEDVEIREYVFDDVQEAGQKEIAAWEASGGRDRAVAAKAAYKQAQSKPKPKDNGSSSQFQLDEQDYEPIRSVKPDEPDLGVYGDGADETERNRDDRAMDVPDEVPEGEPLADDGEENDVGEEEGPIRAASVPHTASALPTQPNQQQVRPQADGEDVHRRRRRRGGRHRGGFHGGPKTP